MIVKKNTKTSEEGRRKSWGRGNALSPPFFFHLPIGPRGRAKKTIEKASGVGRKSEGIQFVHADLLLCQAGHVYIVDYKELEGINTTGESTYTAEPLGLFYVKASGDLVPIAIQLLQQPSDTNPIWTPADSQYDWLLAKMWLRNADHRVQQVLCNFNFALVIFFT